MTEEASDPLEEILRSEALVDAACRLPGELLSTYARLWEFETWLRMMVYVELRARYGDDWKDHLPNEGNTGGAQSQDERFPHANAGVLADELYATTQHPVHGFR